MADAYKASSDQRERLTFSTERLNQSSDRLRESRRAILEAEQIGRSILEDLSQQRETLSYIRMPGVLQGHFCVCHFQHEDRRCNVVADSLTNHACTSSRTPRTVMASSPPVWFDNNFQWEV